MRLLIVVHQFMPEYRGGTEHVAMRLARLAQRNGHFVRVLTCVTGELVGHWQQWGESLFEESYQGVPVTAFRRADLDERADYSLDGNDRMTTEIERLLERDHFDICHVMHSMRMVTAIDAIRRQGIPYVLTLTDFFLPCYRINLINQEGTVCSGPKSGSVCIATCMAPEWNDEKLVNRADTGSRILAQAAQVVCPSDYMAHRFRAEYTGLDVQVIPHGIDIIAFPRPSKRLPRALTFGYLGSIGRIKGVDILLSAFRNVQCDDARLELVGAYENEEFGAEIARMVSADARVTLRGPVEASEVPLLLPQFDVLCIPSVVPETFSLVLHEASAAGVPSLVSSLGAPSLYVEKHNCGRVLAAGDQDAWTSAIQDLCDDSSVLASWSKSLPLPLRQEEEAFFYQSLYRQVLEN